MLNDKLHKQPPHSEYCHMFYVIYFLAYLEHLNECSLICLWADHLSIKARLEYVWILPVNKKGLLTFGQLAEFLEMSFHVTCLAGILSLLIPSTKIIFGTQIFNFFVCFWVCFVVFFGLPLVWFRVIWSVGPCIVHFCPSWWSAWQPQNRGKAVRTEIEFFNPSRLFSASQTAVTWKSFVRFRKPFVNFSFYSYLKKDSLKKGS